VKVSLTTKSILLLAALFGVFGLELFLGSVNIEISEVLGILFQPSEHRGAHKIIVLQSRLPRALTALVAGSGLALCGLLMQTFFRNPLAGPSVLGITSGASLGVAILVLMTSGSGWWITQNIPGASAAVALAAMSGALVVLFIVLLVARRIQSVVSILVFGLMIGYLSGAMVSVLEQGATKEALQAYVFWGMGTFADVQWLQWYILLALLVVSIALIYPLRRYLDAWLLGQDYASSMGVPVGRVRWLVLCVTGVLAGGITAFCGPIAFLGLAVPHLVRGWWQQGSHKWLVPGCLLAGAFLGLLCDLISRTPGMDGGLPLNAVTSMVGAPVVIWIILKGRRVF
jgi:iron complex transport system permease protein